MIFMIFKDGSYIIAKKAMMGSLTWVIKFEDIIEKYKNIENWAKKGNNAYTFPTYKDCIRGTHKENIHNKMIYHIFSHGHLLNK